MTGNDLNSVLSPTIVNHVLSLLKNGRVGICRGNLRVAEIRSGCPSSTEGPCADRLKVLVPYAGHTVTWEFLFNHYQWGDPPDVIFPEDKDFYPDMEKLKSLDSWDSSNENQLYLVLCDLLREYADYQKQLIEGTRLEFEYNSLIEQGLYKEEDIELHCVQKNGNQLGPINFLLKLQIDLSRIPEYLTKDGQEENSAVLLVTFPSLDSPKIVPQLFLSPSLETAIGGSAQLRIPPFPSNSCLMDYAPEVTELLKSTVDILVNGFEKRKEYIGSFISHFGRSLLEYDAAGFTRISFLMEWHDFFFVILIELTNMFPKQQPKFVIQSVYHETEDNTPYRKVYDAYPYSPRWGPEEMADRARTFFLSKIGDFQKDSVLEGTLPNN